MESLRTDSGGLLTEFSAEGESERAEQSSRQEGNEADKMRQAREQSIQRYWQKKEQLDSKNSEHW